MNRNLHLSELVGLIEQNVKDIPRLSQIPGMQCNGTIEDKADGRYIEGVCTSKNATFKINKTPTSQNFTYEFHK